MQINLILPKSHRDSVFSTDNKEIKRAFARQGSIKSIQNDYTSNDKELQHWKEYKIQGKTIFRRSNHTAVSYDKM